MSIRVSIIEDEEIRKQIQEMVQGQFRALVREEVHGFFKMYVEETMRKSITEAKIEKCLNQAADSTVRSSEYWTSRHFDKHLRDKMDTVYNNTIERAMQTTNISAMIEKIIKAKLKG